MRERLRLKRFRLLQVNKKFCREIVLSERIDDMKIIILFFLHRKHICLQHGVIPVTGALLLSIHFKHAFFVRIGNVAVISKFTTPQSWYNILALKDLAEQLLNIHHPFPREIIGGTLFLLFRNHISRAPRHASEFSLSDKHLVFLQMQTCSSLFLRHPALLERTQTHKRPTSDRMRFHKLSAKTS